MKPFTVRSRSGKPKAYGVTDCRLNDRTVVSGEMFLNGEVIKVDNHPLRDGTLELTWAIHKAGALIKETDPKLFDALEECGVTFHRHEDGTLMGFHPSVRDTTMDRKQKAAYRNVNMYMLIQAIKEKIAEEWILEKLSEDATVINAPILEYADEAEPVEYEDERLV